MTFEDLKREREEKISAVDLEMGREFKARALKLVERINREEPYKITKVITGMGTYTFKSDSEEGSDYFDKMVDANEVTMPDESTRYSSLAMDELFELLDYMVQERCDFDWSDLEVA